MTTQRITIAVNKKSALLKHQKREIATLLQDNKIEKVSELNPRLLSLSRIDCDLISRKLKSNNMAVFVLSLFGVVKNPCFIFLF